MKFLFKEKNKNLWGRDGERIIEGGRGRNLFTLHV
jgi:hypothetical protein